MLEQLDTVEMFRSSSAQSQPGITNTWWYQLLFAVVAGRDMQMQLSHDYAPRMCAHARVTRHRRDNSADIAGLPLSAGSRVNESSLIKYLLRSSTYSSFKRDALAKSRRQDRSVSGVLISEQRATLMGGTFQFLTCPSDWGRRSMPNVRQRRLVKISRRKGNTQKDDTVTQRYTHVLRKTCPRRAGH